MDPIKLLRAHLRTKTQRALAEEIPCSAAYLCDVLNGRRDPGPRIMDYLGIELVYRKKKCCKEQTLAP